MFFVKRVFFALLGVLGTLLLDADPAYGLSKEEAVKKCEARITALEQQAYRCSDTIPENFYKSVLADLKGLVDELKKSEEPPKIMSCYTTCQEGLTAMEWLLNRYGKQAKSEAKSEPAPLVKENASKPEVVPAPIAPPVTVQKATLKKKVIVKPNILKVNKKLRIKKSKSVPLKARHKTTKSRKNTARAA